jgi:hypothetical protein
MEKLNLEYEIEKYISCLKCKLIVTEPHECSCCGTLYCGDCVKYVKTCLNCKKSGEFRENSFIKRILNHMNILCPFKCDEKYNYNDIKLHMQKCELRVYNCNICYDNNMTFSGNKKEILSHILNMHEDEILEYNDKYSFMKNSEVKSIDREFLNRFQINYDEEDNPLDYSIENNYEY